MFILQAAKLIAALHFKLFVRILRACGDVMLSAIAREGGIFSASLAHQIVVQRFRSMGSKKSWNKRIRVSKCLLTSLPIVELSSPVKSVISTKNAILRSKKFLLI